MGDRLRSNHMMPSLPSRTNFELYTFTIPPLPRRLCLRTASSSRAIDTNDPRVKCERWNAGYSYGSLNKRNLPRKPIEIPFVIIYPH